jgi:pimeloyl-ACP methyl ester carboxylesterase
MADDIAALIEHLGLDQPDVVGYSLVGGVAVYTATKYPDKVATAAGPAEGRPRAGDPARPDHYNIFSSPLFATVTLTFLNQ